MRIDLHTHSDVSDGTDSPAELVNVAHDAGLDVVALTDHDTFDGLDQAVAVGHELGVEVVRGMELSCSRHRASVHLLAYGADPAEPALAEELAWVREGRADRLPKVLDRLSALGKPLSEEQVLAQVGDSPSIGRPHIADAMVHAGYVADRTEAFDRFLADGGPAHVSRYAIGVERAIDLVHGAGGRGNHRPSVGPGSGGAAAGGRAARAGRRARTGRDRGRPSRSRRSCAHPTVGSGR